LAGPAACELAPWQHASRTKTAAIAQGGFFEQKWGIILISPLCQPDASRQVSFTRIIYTEGEGRNEKISAEIRIPFSWLRQAYSVRSG